MKKNQFCENTLARINAWFCNKCHCYNRVKLLPVPMKSGTTFNARVECYNCGKVQQAKVVVDIWRRNVGEMIE